MKKLLILTLLSTSLLTHNATAAEPVCADAAEGVEPSTYSKSDCLHTIRNIHNAYQLLADIDPKKYSSKLSSFDKNGNHNQQTLAKLTAGNATYVKPILSQIKKDKANICSDNGNTESCLDKNASKPNDIQVVNLPGASLVSVYSAAASNIIQNNFIYKDRKFTPVASTCNMSLDSTNLFVESTCTTGASGSSNTILYKIDIANSKLDKIKEFSDENGDLSTKYIQDSHYNLKSQSLNFYGN